MCGCFEFFILQESVSEANSTISSSRLFIEIHPDAEDVIESLLSRFERNTFEFFGNVDVSCRREGVWPWAIVLFEREFRLAGHVVSLRQQRSDFFCSAYSLKPGEYSLAEHGVPPVSILFINKKQALKDAARESELFKKAWNQLASKSEHQHWICISESPSNEWVNITSVNDDQLFLEIISP